MARLDIFSFNNLRLQSNMGQHCEWLKVISESFLIFCSPNTRKTVKTWCEYSVEQLASVILSLNQTYMNDIFSIVFNTLSKVFFIQRHSKECIFHLVPLHHLDNNNVYLFPISLIFLFDFNLYIFTQLKQQRILRAARRYLFYHYRSGKNKLKKVFFNQNNSLRVVLIIRKGTRI